jgi:predicted ATPase
MERHSSPQRFILTGGPGSGKSTLLEALRQSGYRCYEEVSRQLIREQMSRGTGILPWENMADFAELAVRSMYRQHEESSDSSGICFFDRGIPDVFGYLGYYGLPVPSHYLTMFDSCSYQPEVFLLPPWKEIFVQDRERPQSYDESEALSLWLKAAYTSLGFNVIELPRCSLQERVELVTSVTG